MAKKPKPAKEKKGASPEAEAAAADGEGAGEGEAAPAKKKLAGKTLVLFVVLPVLLLLIGGGAAGYFLLAKPGAHGEAAAGGHDKKAKKEAKGGHGEKNANPAISEGDGVVYYKLPEMLVNITSGDGRPVYLKLKLTLESPDMDTATALEPQLPRVIDQFNAFLRELRVDDLAGSAGAYRLRLELLRRVNLAIAPAHVNAVLIEEMLVQ
ncbi:MAG: flagellar basal body-associated FliL family protein [Hyphomonadaceae bacterium]